MVHKLEYELNLLYVEVLPATYNGLAKNFKTYFKLNNNPITKCIFEAVPLEKIKKLEESLNDASYTDGQFFRALRLCYAVNEDGRIIFIYLPVHVVIDHSEPATQTDYFRIDQYSGDMLDLPDDLNVFYYDREELVMKSPALGTVKQWIRRYRDTISIQRELGGQHEPFNVDVDIQGILFPFKEINTFSSPVIYITSLATFGPTPTDLIKHTLCIANVIPDANVAIKRQISDLGSLCPLHCSEIAIQYREYGTSYLNKLFFSETSSKNFNFDIFRKVGIKYV